MHIDDLGDRGIVEVVDPRAVRGNPWGIVADQDRLDASEATRPSQGAPRRTVTDDDGADERLAGQGAARV